MPLGLNSATPPMYNSLGQQFQLPSNQAIAISAGQGYHSRRGYAGQMSCVIQIIYRILYSRPIAMSVNDYELKLFDISPLGSILLQELSRFNVDYGDYNLFQSLKLVFRYMAEEMVRLYVPPNSNQNRYDANGEYFCNKMIFTDLTLRISY